MKIDSRIGSYTALKATGDKGRQQSRPAESAQGSAGGAPYTVSLSGGPQPAPSGDEAARRERISTIREQLASGSYNISGRDVADKILKLLAA